MGLFKLLRAGDNVRSKDVAKQRLRSCLTVDRLTISPELLEEIKLGLAKAIQDYAVVEARDVEVTLERQAERVALCTVVPIKQLKRRH